MFCHYPWDSMTLYGLARIFSFVRVWGIPPWNIHVPVSHVYREPHIHTDQYTLICPYLYYRTQNARIRPSHIISKIDRNSYEPGTHPLSTFSIIMTTLIKRVLQLDTKSPYTFADPVINCSRRQTRRILLNQRRYRHLATHINEPSASHARKSTPTILVNRQRYRQLALHAHEPLASHDSKHLAFDLTSCPTSLLCLCLP